MHSSCTIASYTFRDAVTFVPANYFPLLYWQRLQTMCQCRRWITVRWWRAQSPCWSATSPMWLLRGRSKSSGTEAMKLCKRTWMTTTARTSQSMCPFPWESPLTEITTEQFTDVRLSCTSDQKDQPSFLLSPRHLTLLLCTVSFPTYLFIFFIIIYYFFLINLCWCLIVDEPLMRGCPEHHAGVEHEFRLDMLPCQADGNPPSSVQWYHEGQPINASQPLSRTHSGKYTAKAANSLGNSSTSVHITIQCECIRLTWLYISLQFR